MNEESFERLAAAIVAQAVRDYSAALLYNNKVQITCGEHFFTSGWYRFLSQDACAGEDVIIRITKKAKKFKKMANDTHERGFISKNTKPVNRAFICPICGGDVFARICRNKDKKYRCRCFSCSATLLL